MITRSFSLPLAVSIFVVASLNLSAQTPPPQPAQLKATVDIRRMRVDLLRDEIKQADARIESRMDTIINTLTSIKDSKDSRTKVARMKEDTMKRLYKTMEYYDQKRASLKEELRNPRLNLTAEEKEKMIGIFDARIEKRAQQLIALYKSMPTHKDYEKYNATGGGWNGNGPDYPISTDYEQNRMITTHSNTQRTALVKALETSINRLDNQNQSLRAKAAACTDPAQLKMLTTEIAKNDTMLNERKKQKLEILTPSETPSREVGLKEAMDMDKAMQTAITDLRREFDSLFYRFNTFIAELSSLHQAEAALAR